MPRVSFKEHEERLRDTERHLVRIGVTTEVQEALSRKYGVNERTVRGWIAEVRRRWAEGAANEEKDAGVPLREIRRHQIREMLLGVYAQAQNRRVVVKDAQGRPVVDRKGEVVTRVEPSLAASLQALKQLRAVDGVDLPRVQHVHLTGGVAAEDPLRDKSVAEQRFFLERGRWPAPDELPLVNGHDPAELDS